MPPLEGEVDVVALSILSGAHMDLFPLIFERLKINEMEEVVVVAGGIIPEEDRAALLEDGSAGCVWAGHFDIRDRGVHPCSAC